MRVLIATFVVLFGLTSCGSVPVELEAAAVVAGDAGEALERDVQVLVDLASVELERMGLALLHQEVERRRLGGSTGEELETFASGQRELILEAAAAKRAQWRDSPNLRIMKEMLGALKEYHASTGGTMRQIEALIAKKETQ